MEQVNASAVLIPDCLKQYEAELTDALALDFNMLDNVRLVNEGWLKLPAQVARVGFLYAQMVVAAEVADRKMKRLWAQARERALTNLSIGLVTGEGDASCFADVVIPEEAPKKKKQGGALRKPTVSDIDGAAQSDLQWQKVAEEAEAATERKEAMRAVVYAMNAKRDAFNSLSATLRAEMEVIRLNRQV